MKRNRLLAALLVLLLVLSGCGVETDSGQEARGASEERGYELIFVCPILENEYWETCANGIRKADEELGTHTTIVGPQTSEKYSTEVIGYMKQAIAAAPDGIMAYAGIDGLFPLIDQATAQGIPVIAMDSDAPSTSRVAFVGTDAYNAGSEAGELMVRLTEGHARVGMTVSSLSAEKEMEVVNAFRDAVADYDIEIVAMEETNANPDIAEEKTRAMLEAYPQINAMFHTAGYNVTGAARVKKALGRDDLVLVGFDDIEENLQYLRQGTINALIVQRIEQVGYQAVYLMKEYLDKGKLSKETYDAGIVIVTQDNIDTYALDDDQVQSVIKQVRVGYYQGDEAFQSGFSEEERKSGYAYEYYQAIAALADWQYEYVYGTRAEILAMLKNGEIDIAAGVYKTEELEKQMLFSQMSMGLDGIARYFAVSREREDLLADLDAAMKKIDQNQPHYTANLYQKYYTPKTQRVLSESERSWLKSKGLLKVGYVRGNLPISQEDENGAISGIVKDMVDLMRDYMRVTVVTRGYGSVSEMEEALRDREIDIALPMYSDLWLSEINGYRQTDAFFSDRVMLAYQGNYSASLMERVALSRESIGLEGYLAEAYPEAEVVWYQTRGEALDALCEGEVRCIVDCSSVLQRAIRENNVYEELNCAYLDTPVSYGMAVCDEAGALLNILNKMIAQTDSATINSAIFGYADVERTYTLQDMLRRYVFAVAAILLTIIALLSLMFVLYRRNAQRFRREQAKANAAMQEVLKAANAANVAKTNFLSSMSHDIRTPMNAIIGMTSIAVKNIGDQDRVKDCLEKIDLSGRHLLTLINNVLDIAKIESGNLSLNPAVFSLQNTISVLVDIIRPTLQAKNLDFEAHVHHLDYEMVYGDEVRINQIFLNILSNAVKYTPENGSVTLDLSETLLADGETLQVIYVVKDTGIGMSEKYMKSMYDSFSRAKDSRINSVQGTGLGLSIVKQMVDLMHGDIACQSQEGVGTTFTVTLELPVRESKEDGRALPGARVLIVDDDPVTLKCNRSVLEDMSAQVDTAPSGEAALELVKAAQSAGTPYDAAVVDWKMPGLSGLETIARLNALTNRAMPCVLASTYDWSFLEEEAKASGVAGFTNKPLFKSNLYEVLSKMTGIGLPQTDDDNEDEQNEKIRGRHLLVAEDNDLNWEVISELLEIYGLSAERAANGRICVDMLTSAPAGKFDLVLMDVQMPEMNGREATRLIRQSSRQDIRNIPIVAMTADAFAEDIAACLDAGMNGHVSKPVDMNILMQELRKHLA